MEGGESALSWDPGGCLAVVNIRAKIVTDHQNKETKPVNHMFFRGDPRTFYLLSCAIHMPSLLTYQLLYQPTMKRKG